MQNIKQLWKQCFTEESFACSLGYWQWVTGFACFRRPDSTPYCNREKEPGLSETSGREWSWCPCQSPWRILQEEERGSLLLFWWVSVEHIPLFFLLPYSMTLVLAGFELPSSLSCNQGALLLKSSTEWLDFKDQGVQWALDIIFGFMYLTPSRGLHAETNARLVQSN